MSRCVVFDVNILVSAVIAPEGAPARAYRGALEGYWDIARSYHIVSKCLEVLGRPRFRSRMSNQVMNDFMSTYQEYAEPFAPDPSVSGIAPDAEDDLVLGTAVAANAGFLVTGDRRLLAIGEYRGVKIITANEFLEVLEKG